MTDEKQHKKMGRPTFHDERMEKLRVNIPPDRIQILREMAAERKRSISDLVREILDNWIEQNRPQ